MAGLIARLGEVGYFVLAVAVLLQRGDGVEVHVRLRIVVGERLLQPPLIQRCARLQLQAVAGDVLRGKGDHGGEGVLPLLHGLPRQPVDEIHADVPEARLPRRRHRLLHLRKGVDAPDGVQQPVIRRLHAQRQTVEPRPAQGAQRLAVAGGVRVGLQRDLRVTGDGTTLHHHAQDAAQPLHAQIAGGAAAEIHRVHPMGLRAGRYLPDMADQRIGVRVHFVLPAGQGVEIAVGALLAAEGDMDIQPQRGFFLFHVSVPAAAAWSRRRRSS